MKNWPWYYFVLIVVLVIGFFYLLHYKPKSVELRDTRNAREQTEREVLQLRAKKKQMDKLQEELKTLDSTLIELEQIIPRQKDTSDILNRTQQLAYESNLDIKTYRPKGLVVREFYSDWPIEIEVQGQYHNLGHFFARLYNYARLFTIDDFIILRLQQQTTEATISAKFTATTYIQRDVPVKEAPAEKTRRK
ncbi:MAG: type 4a pilus biogenesis protein PilO [Candidatus Aminicenantes bacterium]|nr:type 4a pilus biogenesis protein PilO [Candidatus Aminicenantes bacterium]